MNFFPGQRVITIHGTVRTIAVIIGHAVFAYGLNGWLERITPKCEAWGGEHDTEVRNVA